MASSTARIRMHKFHGMKSLADGRIKTCARQLTP